MKRVKSKEWKKLKPEGELPPWTLHFPKINSTLRIQDTKSLFLKKSKLLLLLRRKKLRIKKKTMKRRPKKTLLIREVKNYIMLFQMINKNKKRTKMEILRTIRMKSNSVGIPKKPTSTNQKKIRMVKLKISISKKKVKNLTGNNTIMTTSKKMVKSHSSQEKKTLKKIKSKMMKTDTRKEILIQIIKSADPKSHTMTMVKVTEMTIEDQEAVRDTLNTVIQDTREIISNLTLTEAMMISM